MSKISFAFVQPISWTIEGGHQSGNIVGIEIEIPRRHTACRQAFENVKPRRRPGRGGNENLFDVRSMFLYLGCHETTLGALQGIIDGPNDIGKHDLRDIQLIFR